MFPWTCIIVQLPCYDTSAVTLLQAACTANVLHKSWVSGHIEVDCLQGNTQEPKNEYSGGCGIKAGITSNFFLGVWNEAFCNLTNAITNATLDPVRTSCYCNLFLLKTLEIMQGHPGRDPGCEGSG
eukprot:290497-Pelagomonas_calceolata.AAC.3